MLRIILFFILFFPILIFAGEINLQKVTLQLQWKYQFQFAGFIVAKEKGYYKEHGLDVEILEYTNGSTIKDLETQKVDYAISNNLLAYEDKNLNDVSLIATYFQRSPLVIITQPEINSILELEGKSVMIGKNDRYNSSLSILLEYFKLNDNNTHFVNPSFDIEDFINKKVDATTAFRSNELYELDKRAITYNVIDPVEHGFSTSANNLFTSHDKIKNNSREVKNFLSASKKGWEYALKNIDEVSKLIHEKYQPNKTIEHLKYEGIITKELMLLDIYEVGEINEEFVLKTFKQLIKQRKIAKDQIKENLFFTPKTSKVKIEFSQQEKQWLEQNSAVSFTGDPNWLPYEAFDTQGNYLGIVSEYLELIQRRTGIAFIPSPTSSWSESLNLAQNNKVQIISGDAADAILNEKFKPIQPYSHNPIVIIMDIKNNYVEKLESIGDKKIAIIKDYGYTADIYSTYPKINFIEVENIQEGLSGVSEGKYDAMLSTMALASYTIAEMGLYNVKIVGKTPIIMDLTLFVSRDEPILFSIINKVIKSITQEQKNTILRKWVKQKYIEKTDYTLAVTIALFSLLILVLVVLWTLKLKQEITKRIQIQKQLKLSNEKLSGLYELSPLGIALTDANGRYIEFNEAFREICGYTKEELKVLDYWKLTPKKYKEDEEEQLKSLKETGFYGPYEKEYIRKDGSSIAINLNGMYVTEADGTQYTWSIVEDISKRIEYQKNLEYNAHYDLLTNLPNRVLFADRLNQAMLHSHRQKQKTIILYLDLDGFKEVNDRCGHDIGDKLLIIIAQRMKLELREDDSIARIGGDEFVILLNNFKEINSSTEIIERLLTSISTPIMIDSLSLKVSVSIGVTSYPQAEEVGADQLLRQADQAMYQAKIAGKNRFSIFNPEEDKDIRGHHQAIRKIKVALECHQFELYYQPKVNLKTGEVIGFEALIRWNHPENGLLTPMYFLPSIDGSHLDIEIGEWVIDDALNQMSIWLKKHIILKVSVNISAVHIQQANFVERLKESLLKYPEVPIDHLELEILETTSIDNMSQVVNTIKDLSLLGVRISLDDFGTGYSSLTYLKQLPVNTLKIDQSFVRDMLVDKEDFAIVEGVIGLAKAFNRNVIAEGMEDMEYASILLKLGCELAQGYAIAKPMPADSIPQWIETWKLETLS